MTTIKNTSPISAIIAGVMKDATTEGNRQADLSVAMFANEVTYSVDAILNTFSKDGSEKTETLDKWLEDASDDYGAVLDHMQAIKDKPAKDRTNADTFQLDSLNRKARAARMMFERALRSVYWLRVNGCKNVSSNKIGTGAMKAKMPDPEAKGEYINETYSCNTLANKGNDAIREKLGKATAKTTSARNPVANSIADASKSLAAVLTNLSNDGKRKPITDFSDAEEANLEATFRELFLMKFADDKGKVDFKAADEWIMETFREMPAKPKNAAPAKEAKAA